MSDETEQLQQVPVRILDPDGNVTGEGVLTGTAEDIASFNNTSYRDAIRTLTNPELADELLYLANSTFASLRRTLPIAVEEAARRLRELGP